MGYQNTEWIVQKYGLGKMVINLNATQNSSSSNNENNNTIAAAVARHFDSSLD
jgi:hypothetical protein